MRNNGPCDNGTPTLSIKRAVAEAVKTPACRVMSIRITAVKMVTVLVLKFECIA